MISKQLLIHIFLVYANCAHLKRPHNKGLRDGDIHNDFVLSDAPDDVINYWDEYDKRNPEHPESNAESEHESEKVVKPDPSVHHPGNHDTNTVDAAHEHEGPCWMLHNIPAFLKDLEELEKNLKKELPLEGIKKRQKAFDSEMLDVSPFEASIIQVILANRSVAERAVHDVGGEAMLVPAGFSLGDHTMLRINESLLFFHRMKLRSDTRFTIRQLQNINWLLSLNMIISLGDLHLVGDYEHAETNNHPFQLVYKETYGNAEILLRNVTYTMQARYRLQKETMFIVMVISHITMDQALLKHQTGPNVDSTCVQGFPIEISDVGYRLDSADIVGVGKRFDLNSIVGRMKANLDEWLKDYFNDFLIYYSKNHPHAEDMHDDYDAAKTSILNNFMDSTLRKLRRRVEQLQLSSVKLPPFNIITVNGMNIKLTDGVLHGMDTFFRRSVATQTITIHKHIHVDAILGFSGLTVRYKYDIVPSAGQHRVGGIVLLNINEATVQMSIQINPENHLGVIKFQYLKDLRPLTLTVQGTGNLMIANLRHTLENHVMTLMYNQAVRSVERMHSLDECQPAFEGYKDLGDFDNPVSDDTDEHGQPAVKPKPEVPHEYHHKKSSESVQSELAEDHKNDWDLSISAGESSGA